MKLEQANAMTLQQLFDYAIEKLVAQGKQCVNEYGACIYDDEAGNHCGIGWLLDKDRMKLPFLGGSIFDVVENAYEVPKPIRDNLPAALDFQELHDAAERVDRAVRLRFLNSHGINTDNPAYQQWVEMGQYLNPKP